MFPTLRNPIRLESLRRAGVSPSAISLVCRVYPFPAASLLPTFRLVSNSLVAHSMKPESFVSHTPMSRQIAGTRNIRTLTDNGPLHGVHLIGVRLIGKLNGRELLGLFVFQRLHKRATHGAFCGQDGCCK